MRTGVAILAILLAALLPVLPVVLCAVIALLVFVVARTLVRVRIVCDDQPVALLSLVSFRAPPSLPIA